MLSFLFLQSELPREVFRRVEDFVWIKTIKKIFLKKFKKYFVSSKKVFTFALANENGSGFKFVNREEIIKIKI